MDQVAHELGADPKSGAERLSHYIAASVGAARAEPEPFAHLTFSQIFPPKVYAAILDAMPVASDYRPMSGRSKGNDLADGTHTRVKIDLFPEYIRHLPPAKRDIWSVVGRSLRSRAVQDAFVRKLAQPLQRRFGPDFVNVGLFPIPILTRDIPGYRITPHTDTSWKAITVQIYLPRDDANTNIGTIFHDVLPDGSLPKNRQMPFKPNSGYAFTVGGDTWHSADPVGPEVSTRDSILLTYFVDSGPLCFLRNRGKRIGNFLLNEVRNLRP